MRSLRAAWRPCASRTTSHQQHRSCINAVSQRLSVRTFETQHAIPLRKHLKDESKRRKAESKQASHGLDALPTKAHLDRWELTVGIEIHAELNTACKLFSSAPTAPPDGNGLPNSHVAVFDAALPGTQPIFQHATILPALRAAIAMGCQIQRTSGWDRKHYFHWDQPNGYQITQYYRPFAKDGQLLLSAEDGVPAQDLHVSKILEIGIKQIQMEQDTAKTTSHGSAFHHIDLNRAGHPLIEIITLPQIHSPQTAAAVVRKVQALLKSVDACITGMELGGLRADVNVSVRERGTDGVGSHYSGVSGLGQRTEIKNLSSFAAVEKAVIAERDRQISVLEAGGQIEGETRGWTLGARETTRLRGKEGEVDYRYMPDPDLPPLVIGNDLVRHLKDTLPELPDATAVRLQQQYGLTAKDAKTLAVLDDGDRLEYLESTISHMLSNIPTTDRQESLRISRLASNWVLHELGGLLTTSDAAWEDMTVTEAELSDILLHLHQKHITSRAAKQLLVQLHEHPATAAPARPSVEQLIHEGNLRLRPLSEEGYTALAQGLLDANPEKVAAVRDKGQRGKVMWFVGQMVRAAEEGTVEPEKAREVVERLIEGG